MNGNHSEQTSAAWPSSGKISGVGVVTTVLISQTDGIFAFNEIGLCFFIALLAYRFHCPFEAPVHFAKHGNETRNAVWSFTDAATAPQPSFFCCYFTLSFLLPAPVFYTIFNMCISIHINYVYEMQRARISPANMQTLLFSSFFFCVLALAFAFIQFIQISKHSGRAFACFARSPYSHLCATVIEQNITRIELACVFRFSLCMLHLLDVSVHSHSHPTVALSH